MRFFEQRWALEREAFGFPPLLAGLQSRNALQALGVNSDSRCHGSAATRARSKPRAYADHDESGGDRSEHDRDYFVEMMWNERSHQQINRGDENDEEKAEPGDFRRDGRRRLRH